MNDRELVMVVDDDPGVCRVTQRLLEAEGVFECRAFTSPAAAMEAFTKSRWTCVVTDLRMPLTDGAELQQQMLAKDGTVSIVFVTGHADVAIAVQLMERGAVTLLEKPFQPEALVAAVRRGVEQTRRIRQEDGVNRTTLANLARLAPEEQEILECMVAGLSNKAISAKLAVSSRTLDRRRRNILETMGVGSRAELAALIERVRRSSA